MEKTITLNDGRIMPCVGFGVWEMSIEQAAENVVTAIKCGYRLIDTAAYYKNEEGVGRAIAVCGVPRDELFITSKVWPEDMTEKGTRDSFMRSLDLMGLDYLDMFLLHWPIGDVLESWKVLESLQKEGLVRTIGVSNFMPAHLDALMKTAKVCPAVNQFESNPYYNQEYLAEHTRKLGITPQAWAPLGKGRVLGDPVIADLAEKYGVSPAQTILRWGLQRGIAVIPKSSSESRMRENRDIYRFELNEADMELMNSLDKGTTERMPPAGYNPEVFGTIPKV